MFKTATLTLLPAAIFSIFSAVHDFQKDLPNPVEFNEEKGRVSARLALEEVKAPKERLAKLTNGVYAASVATGIDPILIASIIKPESGFNINAKSPKGYVGLMQGPVAMRKWQYAEADIMVGALILKEKIDIAKGDVDRGMVFYKGHGGKESQKIASIQMADYRKIKEQVELKIKDLNKKG